MRKIKEIKKNIKKIEALYLSANGAKQEKAAHKELGKLTLELNQARKVKQMRKAKDANKEAKAEDKLASLRTIAGAEDHAEVTGDYDNSPEAKVLFQKRIWNEKRNMHRQFGGNPKAMIAFIEANRMDERNAAVRFGRDAAYKWALANKDLPEYQNIMPF